MTDRIKSLSVESFRGATQPFELHFDTKKSVALIFGENGTGKSTIVDALECVGSGSTAFLDDWKLGQGKRKESYIPTLGKVLSDVKISLQLEDQTYTAELKAGGIQLCNMPNRPQTKVLRRKSLQAFIDADPAQRYKEVATFLNMPQIVSAETSLRQAYKRAKEIYEQATQANRQAEETLHGLWEAEGSPGLLKKEGEREYESAEAWARPQAKNEIKVLQQQLTDLQIGVKHGENTTKKYQTYKLAIKEDTEAKEDLERAQGRQAELETENKTNNAQLLTLLEDAKDYLQTSPDKLCPVCEETEIEATALIKRLQQRIEGMDNLKQANEAIKRATSNKATKSELRQRAEELFLDAAQDAQNHFEKKLTDNLSIKAQREKNKPHALKLAAAVNDDLSLKQLDLQTQPDELQKQIHTLTNIKQLITTLDEKAGEAKRTELLQRNLGLAVKVFEKERKTYVETVLLEIAESVDDLYQKIHTNEKLGGLKLKLDEKKQGSLIYGVAFENKQDIQPQPYYSESHLDTLGLCIFLALAKRGSADKTIVILDDVLGSVDQQHLAKTLEMLLEECNGFAQVVMTTHYRPLRDRFRYSHNSTAPVQLIELRPWNFEHGIRSGKTKLYVDELKQLLKEDDCRRDVIASQAGQLFENLLEFISRTYRCKVPHVIEPRFTFGQLANAPNKQLKKALEIVKQTNGGAPKKTGLKQIYDELDSMIGLRNLVGCHFNELAGERSDEEIKNMAEQALKFANTLICDSCGGLPTSNKSGKYWECSCKETQMNPLSQPKQ
ncbi:MAG: hypothetical protein A6F72_07525 [Cycloclasticus sp. symbiont of Poecilosclerida sp. N]|nr:MAG: hypothetical protein A6F72_07525 [Cycloclasticus sp. symbiont of Poecilosclerida sp. N]